MRSLVRSGALVALLLVASGASATDVFEFPDTGTEPMSRAGAWVARATNPLAVIHNPAGLAGQETGALANVHLVFNDVCFTRAGQGSTVEVHRAAYPEACDDTTLTPLPAVAGVLSVTDRLGIGLAFAPPNVYGSLSFPHTVELTNSFGARVEVPSPMRYLLLEQDGIVANVTLGAGYEVAKNVRVGAGFVWGFGALTLINANMSVSPIPQAGVYEDPLASDVLAEIRVSDWFMPGFTIGALYSPLPVLDVGFSLTAQEAFDGHGDLTAKANYWTNNGVSDNPTLTESSDLGSDLAHFRLPNPLEAKIGVRYHQPRDGAAPEKIGRPRDPLADDVFDIELDLSYTRNSAYDQIELRFPRSPVIVVQGTGGAVPQNGDVPLAIKGDTLGVRLGGEYVILPARVAVRAGGWYEPDVQRPEYLNVAVLASQRFGLALGGVVRLGPVDVEAGYMHVFFDEVDNGGDGRVRAISGDVSAGNRSPYGINGGKVTQSANIVSVGAVARF